MAAINDLISQIENPELRTRIQQEVTKMSKQKKFGLIFEEHLPENTPLYDLPIRKGTRVAKRDGDIRDNYIVISVNDDIAECEHLDDKHEQCSFPTKDLIAVAQFGEPIYPYLKPMDSICNAPDSELWHTLIQADNYHALQLLVYLYSGMVDCIYIDPPYNTGARDWKYNNDYVDSNDSYRHSKWLSFMKKRLHLSKKLLNTKDSVLIVTIDEKEYLHLGCMLEEMFPEGRIQMVSDAINRKGSMRQNGFQKTDEYIFFVIIGDASPSKLPLGKEWTMSEEETNKGRFKWQPFIRGNFHRHQRPNLFYPIFTNLEGTKIIRVGNPLSKDENRQTVVVGKDERVIFPLTTSGEESVWHLSYDSFLEALNKGYVKLGKGSKKREISISYLSSGTQQMIESGLFDISSRNEDGSVVYETNNFIPEFVTGTQWRIKSHDATSNGTKLLSDIIGKRFSYPKSLYTVHDTLRFFVSNKPDALILDFFAGSGTSLHAVNLLNKEDGGNRRCILVTNNEVSEVESKTLTKQGYKPGDLEWERLGIAQYVTWPRTICSIKGTDVNGKSLEGKYYSNLSETRQANRHCTQIDFCNSSITYKQKKTLITLLNKQPKTALPSLKDNTDWLLDQEDDKYNASILFDITKADEWLDALDGCDHITEFFIITDKDADFKKIKQSINEQMGQIEEIIPIEIPMSEGFLSNAAFFKLGFLDKTAVALGRQFREMLPLLWMKAGAKGVCPQLESDIIPSMLILPENHMAVLIDEKAFSHFVELVNEHNSIQMVYLVLDSDSMYREMARCFPKKQTCQLYRDYLDNFRINITR